MDSIITIGLVILFATSTCMGILIPGCVMSGVGDVNSTMMDEGVLSTSNFSHHDTLDERYELSWNFNSTHIVFKAHVRANGYIGFGLSENGRMFPADVVIGGVNNGQTYFNDRYSTRYGTPRVDTHEDWTLIQGSEEGEYTTLVFMRALNTCDDEDMEIVPGPNHVIYSYRGIRDEVNYHGRHNRGTKPINFLEEREHQHHH